MFIEVVSLYFFFFWLLEHFGAQLPKMKCLTSPSDASVGLFPFHSLSLCFKVACSRYAAFTSPPAHPSSAASPSLPGPLVLHCAPLLPDAAPEQHLHIEAFLNAQNCPFATFSMQSQFSFLRNSSFLEHLTRTPAPSPCPASGSSRSSGPAWWLLEAGAESPWLLQGQRGEPATGASKVRRCPTLGYSSEKK